GGHDLTRKGGLGPNITQRFWRHNTGYRKNFLSHHARTAAGSGTSCVTTGFITGMAVNITGDARKPFCNKNSGVAKLPGTQRRGATFFSSQPTRRYSSATSSLQNMAS